MTADNAICPACGSIGMDVFYEVRDIPVHSCLMFEDRRAAIDYPKRPLALGLCGSCGFISNILFDPNMKAYSGECEDQQSFSPRFQAFQTELVNRLIERYDVRDKDVLEIGCGKGDFLIELCRAGGNRGVGIDPACVPERVADRAGDGVRLIADYYSEVYSHLKCDFVCCRHTLEHIHCVDEFIRTVRNAIGDRPDTIVFFDLPAAERVLRERAFWDVYYEHCSYFTLGSLARLFRRNRFNVVELSRDYDEQYLTLLARPVDEPTTPAFSEEADLGDLVKMVDRFRAEVKAQIDDWRVRLGEFITRGRRVAIWGSGSKCVSFMSALEIDGGLVSVVDINPYRHGKFLAGSGKQVLAPESLRTLQPDAVFVMNPIYCKEIQQDLGALGVQAELVPV